MSHRLFICGVPGTGKTSIGDYLSAKLGFIHIDIEREMVLPDLNDIHHDIVVTWGFVPDDSLSLKYVDYLRNNGFKLIWLDGNRVASQKAFLARNTVPIEAYNRQIEKINSTKIILKLNPILINPFQANSLFKAKEDIVAELLGV
jgi:hypothetical protein